MSLAARSYSKESRSSSFYSRSSSYHASSSNEQQQLSSSRSRVLTDIDRPLLLSERLIERDSSWPSLTWDWDWDDPLFFSRRRFRWDDPFWRFYFALGRTIPVNYRTYEHSSSARTIPVQYHSALTHRPRRPPLTSSSSFIKHDEGSMRRENRLSDEEWPPKQGPPTRKRTSLTIFVQQPYVDLSNVPYYRQTLPTPTYPQSERFDYY